MVSIPRGICARIERSFVYHGPVGYLRVIHSDLPGTEVHVGAKRLEGLVAKSRVRFPDVSCEKWREVDPSASRPQRGVGTTSHRYLRL